jgi:general secretion pathway protein F
MTIYHYSAILPGGKVATGLVEACNERAVLEAVRGQEGLLLAVGLRDNKSSVFGNLLSLDFQSGKLNRRELADCTRELSVMLGAGQDLDRALLYLVNRSRKKRVRKILIQVRDAIRDGSSLAGALAQHPSSFPLLYIGLIRAAEAGGIINTTFSHLSYFLEREGDLRSVVATALIYPTILVVAGILVVIFLLNQVLPQFIPLLYDAGAAVPLPTQIIIEVGQAVNMYGIYSGVLLAIVAIFGRQALTVPAIRYSWNCIVLQLPIVGYLMRELIAARFSRCLGTLLESGVPLVTALGITCDVLGNTAAIAAVRLATEGAKEGAGLARSLQGSRAFPERMIDLLRLGEETGQLAKMSLRAAGIHEDQCRIAFQRLTQLLAPALLVVLGLVVTGVVISVLMPILAIEIPP